MAPGQKWSGKGSQDQRRRVGNGGNPRHLSYQTRSRSPSPERSTVELAPPPPPQEEWEDMAHVAQPIAIDVEAYKGASALHLAVAAGKLEQLIAVLQTEPASVHSRDLVGQTPLHWAAKQADLETVRLLCQYGAVLTAEDEEDNMPLDIAATKEIEMYLQAANDARNRPLHLHLPDWTNQFLKSLNKIMGRYTTLQQECHWLQSTSPVAVVSHFPNFSKNQRRFQRWVEAYLSSYCLAQSAYLVDQHIRTSSLQQLVAFYETNVEAHDRFQILLNKLDQKATHLEQHIGEQTKQTLLIKEEQLRKAETKINELTQQTHELQEQLSGAQQERDEALAAAQQLRAENKRLQSALEMAQTSAAHRIENVDKASSSGSSNTSIIVANDPLITMAASQPEQQPFDLESEAHLSHQQQVVRAIRRDRAYDIAVPTGQMERCFRALSSSLDSALQKLSEDIYSSASRFILELIQNADDNHYNADVAPAFKLELSVSQGFVFAMNNEVGFNEANVRSLCEIGGSTKVDANRYIGRKGVGFKSVFKVTDCPHVFSNGFFFRFDSRKRLGHIVPEWLDVAELAAVDKKFERLCLEYFASLLNQQLDGTVFYLPLRSTNEIQIDELVDDLAGADHTLLFLRRLVSLDLTVDVNEKTDAYAAPGQWRTHTRLLSSRRDDVEQVLDIHTYHNGAEILPSKLYRYRTFRRLLDVPSHLVERGTDGGSSSKTEITLAFPVLTQDDIVPVQMVYAFLPIRKVGFHFIIQGDFQLVTSRQDIHRSKPFNSWIRDQIATLFVDCLREDAYVRGHLNLFVPDETEISDAFWRPLVDKLWALLQSENCIPCESGRLRAPKDVLVKPLRFDDLITNDELIAHLNKEFLSGSFDRDRALKKLRLNEFGPQDLIDCLVKMNLENRPPSWFAKLFTVLQRFPEESIEPLLAKLATLSIFPLSSSTEHVPIVSRAACKGFLYSRLPAALLEDTSKNILDFSIVSVMHPDAVTSSGEVILKRLGISVPTLASLVEMMILQHANGTITRKKDRTALAQQLRFIRDHVGEYTKVAENSIEDVQKLLWLPSIEGDVCHGHELYFVACRSLWENIPGAEHVRHVDEDLLVAQSDATDLPIEREKWRSFLMLLGVETAPRLIVAYQPPTAFTPRKEQDQSPILATTSSKELFFSTSLEYPYVSHKDGSRLALVPSAELKAVLHNGESVRVGLLIKAIDESWERVPYSRCPDLWTSLRALSAPTTLGHDIPFSQTYSHVHLGARFGHALPYLTSRIVQRDMLQLLGVTCDLTADIAVRILEMLSKENRGEPHVWHTLYGFLADAEAANQLKDLEGRLRQVQRFCVANPSFAGAVETIEDEASFIAAREIIRWRGHEQIANAAGMVLLETRGFSRWRDLMLNIIGIEQELKIRDYVTGFFVLTVDQEGTNAPLGAKALHDLPSHPPRPQHPGDRDFIKDERWEAIEHHYARLEDKIRKIPVSLDDDWVGTPLLLWKLSDSTPYWSYWQAGTSAPPYPDDPNLVALFLEEVDLVLLHPIFCYSYPLLVKRLGARPFSKHVKKQFIPEQRHGVFENMASTLLYRRAISLAFGLTISADKENEGMISAEAKERQAALLDMERQLLQFVRVYDVNKLLVNYTITTVGGPVQREREETICYQHADRSHPPRLFLSTQLKAASAVLAINFGALSLITNIPRSKLELFFASQHIQSMLTVDLGETALKQRNEEARWQDLQQRARLFAENTRFRGGRGRGRGRGTGSGSGSDSRFRGDHSRLGPNQRMGHSGSFVLDRLLGIESDPQDDVDDAENHLGYSSDRDKSRDSQLFSFRPSPYGPPQFDAEKAYLSGGDQPMPGVMTNRPYLSNDRSSIPLTADAMLENENSLQKYTPFSIPSEERKFMIPRIYGQSKEFTSLHAPSSVAMLRHLPGVTHEELSVVMNQLGYVDTEHVCKLMYMDDESCDQELSEVVSQEMAPNELIQVAKQQLGLPTIVGRREGGDNAYYSSMREDSEIVRTHVLDKKAGQLAELFLFKYLTQQLGSENFGPENWVSRARERYFPDSGSGDDTAGYDFKLVDKNGWFGAHNRGKTFFLEVKGQLSYTKKTVYLSDNEWDKAKAAAQSSDSMVFVLVVICLNPPKILQWLENPIELTSRGWIDVRPDSYACRIRVPWLTGLDGSSSH